MTLGTGVLFSLGLGLGVTALHLQRQDFSTPLQPRAQESKKLLRLDSHFRVLAKLQQGRWLLRTYQEHAQSVAVCKLKGGVAPSQLGPESIHAKVALAHGAVMKEHDGALGELGQPGFKIVSDGLVGVQSVDVQQVNAAVGKLGQCCIKGHAQQGGKTLVMGVVGFFQGLIDMVAVQASVGIALPSVYGIGSGSQPLLRNGLAKRQVGDARVRPKLDKTARLLHRDQPGGKWNMPSPRGRRSEVVRLHEGGRMKQIHGHKEAGWGAGRSATDWLYSSMHAIGIPTRPALALVDSERKVRASKIHWCWTCSCWVPSAIAMVML